MPGFYARGDGIQREVRAGVAEPERRAAECEAEFHRVDVRRPERGVERETGPLGFGEQLSLRDGDILSPAIDAREPLKAQCGHFLHCIRRGQMLRTDARQGLAVVRVIEAVNRSMELAGAPVQLGSNGQGGVSA